MPITDSPKDICDMALGTAETCAFAFGPAGAEIAAAIAVGKFLFDLLYPPASKGLSDPLAQAPSQADLNLALSELRGKLAEDMFKAFTKTYQSELFAASTTLNDAIRNAGQKPKTGACLPGQTPVWNDAETDPIWQPVRDNPSILKTTQEWIIASPQYRYDTATLYALTVSLQLLYYKTGIAWEINNNLRDYELRKDIYDKADQTYKTAMIIWQAQGQDPATKPAPVALVDPSPPSWGDPADGSETYDRGLITGYKSRLGKAQSWFAIQTRNLLQQKDSKGNPCDPMTYLEGVLNGHDADIAAKNKVIDDRTALVQDISASPNSPLRFVVGGLNSKQKAELPWYDTRTGDMGSTVFHAGFQTLQSQLWKDNLAAVIDRAETDSRRLPGLTDNDKVALRKVIVKWRETLKMYEDAL